MRMPAPDDEQRAYLQLDTFVRAPAPGSMYRSFCIALQYAYMSITSSANYTYHIS